eukprot:CAMPEP_0198287368 /NCGR_PEP_ID=MMETSP1449-20131203/6214_1 /TAXON_ID=420275 /ORGANISM="Attheya septentrionalis, Strain CCMP2084" /LENGTH=69 /DNA_ID=CAMNT_0043985315 /DNA_START=357 /DNA_END=563 /DNA_ORIENTATION=+
MKLESREKNPAPFRTCLVGTAAAASAGAASVAKRRTNPSRGLSAILDDRSNEENMVPPLEQGAIYSLAL